MTKIITTKRLTLRRYVPSDANRVAQLIGDLDVSRWLTRVPHPYSREDATWFIGLPRDPEVLLFAILLDDHLIGGVSAEEELGYWLGKPYWGHGYMSEAARAVITEYFGATETPLGSGHMVGNIASRNVLKKLGFVDTVLVDAACASLDKTVDLQKMTLTRQAFEEAS